MNDVHLYRYRNQRGGNEFLLTAFLILFDVIELICSSAKLLHSISFEKIQISYPFVYFFFRVYIKKHAIEKANFNTVFIAPKQQYKAAIKPFQTINKKCSEVTNSSSSRLRYENKEKKTKKEKISDSYFLVINMC